MEQPEAWARWERTRTEVCRARGSVDTWLNHRDAKDVHQQYSTQLKALRALLVGGYDALLAALVEARKNPPERLEGVYREARRIDTRANWLGRVGQFYRERFDQRDDDTLVRTLQIADELVWSCYRPCFLLNPQAAVGPPPLPYIDYLNAPEAFPADIVPGELRTGVDSNFLAEYLSRLPIPLVRIPAASVDAPWWQVLLGHEVGHHLQYDLAGERGLVDGFRRALQGCLNGKADGDRLKQWGRWGQEIFADLYSLHVMGPAAISVIEELELNDRERMARRRPRYPAALVRSRLMRRMADVLGLPATPVPPAFAGHPGPEEAELAEDLRLVEYVAPLAGAKLPGMKATLGELMGFRAEEFARRGEAENWRVDLNRPKVTTRRGLAAPRWIAYASWSIYAVVKTSDNASQANFCEALARSTENNILANREEGVRRGDGAANNFGTLGADFVNQLFEQDELVPAGDA